MNAPKEGCPVSPKTINSCPHSLPALVCCTHLDCITGAQLSCAVSVCLLVVCVMCLTINSCPHTPVVVLHGLCVVSLIMFLVIIVSKHCVHDLCSCYVLSCVVYKSLIRRGSPVETQQNQVTLVVLSSLQSIATLLHPSFLPTSSPSIPPSLPPSFPPLSTFPFPSLFLCSGKLYRNKDFVEERHRHRYEVPRLRGGSGYSCSIEMNVSRTALKIRQSNFCQEKIRSGVL